VSGRGEVKLVSTEKEKEIYNFCNERWEHYIEKDGGYSPNKHDDVVLHEASKKFNLSTDKVYQIIIKVGKPIADEQVKKMSPNEIREAAINIVLENKDNPFKR
jgi:predicted ATPase with chaperone activity